MSAPPDTWDGRPPNHEREGVHWLSALSLHPDDAPPVAWTWEPSNDAWRSGPFVLRAPDEMARVMRYLGPCLPPAEAAALRQRAEAAEAVCTAVLALQDTPVLIAPEHAHKFHALMAAGKKWKRARAAAEEPAHEQRTTDCGCYRCLEDRAAQGFTGQTPWSAAMRWTMIVCPTCGNKRCPHASDHRLACTGSNEPGQAGSIYA